MAATVTTASKLAALPVGAPEVQPHSEFVERQAKADGVGYGRGGEPPALGAHEEEVAAARAEEKDSVIEMMDVGAGNVEEKLRGKFSGHDVDDEDSCEEEGEEERGEDQAGEAVGQALLQVARGEGGWLAGGAGFFVGIIRGLISKCRGFGENGAGRLQQIGRCTRGFHGASLPMNRADSPLI